MNDPLPTGRRKLRHRLTFEGHITWLIVGAVAPAAIVSLAILWFGDYTPKVQWTLTLVVAACAAFRRAR